MAGSFYDGCDNPKKTTPGQLLSYCKKISANTQHLLFDVLHLHFYSTKETYKRSLLKLSSYYFTGMLSSWVLDFNPVL